MQNGIAHDKSISFHASFLSLNVSCMLYIRYFDNAMLSQSYKQCIQAINVLKSYILCDN